MKMILGKHGLELQLFGKRWNREVFGILFHLGWLHFRMFWWNLKGFVKKSRFLPKMWWLKFRLFREMRYLSPKDRQLLRSQWELEAKEK